jgi:hypothetical protein
MLSRSIGKVMVLKLVIGNASLWAAPHLLKLFHVDTMELAIPSFTLPFYYRGQQFAQQIQQQNPEFIEQLRNHIRSRSFSSSTEEHS